MTTNKWRTFARSENWRAEKKAEREARVETPTIQAEDTIVKKPHVDKRTPEQKAADLAWAIKFMAPKGEA